MDQKRILWIAAAVGIFLLVVVGAALILYSPSFNAEPVMVSVQQQDSQPILTPAVNSVTTTNKEEHNSVIFQQDGATSVPVTEKVKELTVISENTTIYSDKATYTQEGSRIPENSVTQNPPQQTQIQIQIQPMSQETVATQTVTTTPVVAKANTSTNVVPASTSVTSAAKETVKKTTTVSTSTVAQKTTTAASTAKKTTTAAQQKAKASYWIQAASFTAKKNAEEARTVLSEQKISSEIFTYESKGNTYYRVRIGPYVTKAEAEYWKGRIALIKGFESCYITDASLPAVKK